MVAGVIKLYFKLDKLDEAIDYWNSIISAAKKEDPLLKEKLQGYLFLVDRKTGHGYSIGVWENPESSLEFQNSMTYMRNVGELAKFCVKPPVREQFEVAGGNLEFALLNKLAA